MTEPSLATAACDESHTSHETEKRCRRLRNKDDLTANLASGLQAGVDVYVELVVEQANLVGIAEHRGAGNAPGSCPRGCVEPGQVEDVLLGFGRFRRNFADEKRAGQRVWRDSNHATFHVWHFRSGNNRVEKCGRQLMPPQNQFKFEIVWKMAVIIR
jgi:hypothetical protein